MREREREREREGDIWYNKIIGKYLKDMNVDYFFYSGYRNLYQKYQLIKLLEIRRLTKNLEVEATIHCFSFQGQFLFVKK